MLRKVVKIVALVIVIGSLCALIVKLIKRADNRPLDEEEVLCA